MTQVALEEAGPLLNRLAVAARAGEEVVITENDLPVLKLVSVRAQRTRQRPRFGSGKGQVLHIAPDFDAPLDEMTEYMH